MVPYTIPIPAPMLDELEQLAQISTPDGRVVAVFWRRATRQAVCVYNRCWYIQSDQNIINAIAQIIGYEKPIDMLAMDELVIFETAGQGIVADSDLIKNFRECEWSDYASDRMVFQCRIYEKNDMFSSSNNDYTLADPLPVNHHVTQPPILSTVSECSCCECGTNSKN